MSKNEKKIRAWHFSDGALRYGDRRVVRTGETYSMFEVDKIPKLCVRGMHASVRPIDAIGFCKGCVVSRVELWGDIQQDDKKIVARHRKVLWCADATEVLRRFARMCALDVVHLWDAPDVVLRYLKTGDESLRTGAYSAAAAATAAAATATATAATAHVAYAAAYAAANATAASVASANAQREKQNDRLYRMLMKLKP